MHQKLTRTGDFRFFMRTHLISRRKARIAEKQLPVAHIHMRQIDRGATSSDTLDFPATQLQPCLETLLDRVVESARLLRMSGVALFLFFAISSLFFLSFLDAAQFYQANANHRPFSNIKKYRVRLSIHPFS